MAATHINAPHTVNFSIRAAFSVLGKKEAPPCSGEN